MLAYHRDSVETLNRAARAVWGKLGRLSGPELEAPGGRRFRAGDRVVTLSPVLGGLGFDTAMQAWRAVGEPEAQLLEARRCQVAPEVTRLERAQHAREAFLAEHSDVPGRISELNRAIEAREQLENMRRFGMLRAQEHARQFQRGHDLQPDLGYGIDL